MDVKQRIPALVSALSKVRAEKPQIKMFIGVDGFVDSIIHVVDQRFDAENYTRIHTISDFAARASKAAGLSTNFEFVSVQTKLGGNGPIYANALVEYGVDVTYFGAVGDGNVHPVFSNLAKKGTVFAISEPANTDAVEFDDGKLIINKGSLNAINWELVKTRLGGAQAIADHIKASDLFGMENWTMVTYMNELWEGLIAEVLPLLPDTDEKPFMFFDLCDPERRPVEDLKRGLGLLREFETKFRVILGLNKKEAFDIAGVYGVTVDASAPEAQQLEAVTTGVCEKLGIYCLVVHPTKEAACCLGGRYYHTDGPFTAKPVLTTGAGDNFNTGFCMGQAIGLSPRESLLLAVATSGYYVRNAKSPTLDDVIAFLGQWSDELS